MCLGAFFSLEEGSTTIEGANPNDGPSWIIGDTFLKNVYSIFRYNNPTAVGFAKLSDIAKGLSSNNRNQSVSTVTVTNQSTAISAATQIQIRLSSQMFVAVLASLMVTLASIIV